MPLLRVETTAKISHEKKSQLALNLSRILAEVTRKPEAYCMVIVMEGVSSAMGGKDKPVAYVDIRGIGGFNKQVNAELSARVGSVLCKELGLDLDAIYLTFTDVAGTNWGWKGGTFA